MKSSVVALSILVVSILIGVLISNQGDGGAFVSAQGKKDTPEEHVYDLTDETINHALTNHPLIFVMFYAPWCGHSKKLLPQFAHAAAGDHPHITYAKIDATVNKQAAKKFNIKAFPTLKFFRNGKPAPTDYDGGRTAEDLTRYTEAMKRSAVMAFPHKDAFEEYRGNAPWPFAVCVEHVSSDACKIFDHVADEVRGQVIRFYALESTEIAKQVGLAEYIGKIILVRPAEFDERIYVVKNTASVEEMRQEIQIHSLPVFAPLDPTTYKMYMSVKLPMLYLFVSDAGMSKPADKAAWNAAKQVGNDFKGKITFVSIDASKYAGMAQRVGLSGDKFPAVAIDQAGSFYVYPSDKEITSAGISAFANDYLGGRLSRVLRSEKPPGAHTTEGLTTVVASTFAELVDKSEHDVFIQFYAPWCGHCKEMEPALNELAKKVKDEDVRIAKFDATVNDYDKKKYPVHGFPTLFYVKKGESPVEYTGERTLKEMEAFVHQHADL